MRLLCPCDFPGRNTRMVAISSSRVCSWPRDRMCASCAFCPGRQAVYQHATWGETEGPWPCLMARLLLFGLLWLFSFVSLFPHFSDETSPLATVFPRTKGRPRTWAVKITEPCSASGGHCSYLLFALQLYLGLHCSTWIVSISRCGIFIYSFTSPSFWKIFIEV